MLIFKETEECCGCYEVIRIDDDNYDNYDTVGSLMRCVDWLFDTKGEAFESGELKQIAAKLDDLNN